MQLEELEKVSVPSNMHETKTIHFGVKQMLEECCIVRLVIKKGLMNAWHVASTTPIMRKISNIL